MVWSHHAVFVTEAPTRFQASDLPQASAPLQSFTHRRGACDTTLSRGFLVPTAQPILRGPPILGSTCPGHVAPLHLPCASAPYSLEDLPGVLSTRRAHGTRAFRAYPNEDRPNLSAGPPLLRLANHSRVKQTVKPTPCRHLPEIGHPKAAHRTGPKARPSQINDALTRYQR